MDVVISAATGADAEAILPAYEWLFALPGGRPPGWDEKAALDRIAATISSSRSTIFMAVPEGATGVVGICSAYLDLVSVRYGLRCWVEDLAVDPDYRSRSIGERLLTAARQWAESKGATHLELDTGERRKDAQRFYERLTPDTRTRCYGWRF